MLDLSDIGLKFNPTGGRNAGTRAGSVLGGGARGVVEWINLDTAVSALGYIKSTGLAALLNGLGFWETNTDRSSDPFPLNQVFGMTRIFAGDSGLYVCTPTGDKFADDAVAVQPVSMFAYVTASIESTQQLSLGSFLMVNDVAVPAGTVIECGFYPISSVHGSNQMKYNISETEKIVQSYSGGYSANTITGIDYADKNADFRAATPATVNYALGIKLSGTAVPANAVWDVWFSLRSAPY